MLNADDVCQRARVISDMSTEEALSLFPFCEPAAAVINEKKRTDADASDIRLVTAAAALALSNYFSVKYSVEGDMESFKAGDVTVSYSADARMKTIENIKKAAFADASGLLVDDGFIFDCI